MMPIMKQEAIIDYHIDANKYAPVLDLEVDEYDMENTNNKDKEWRVGEQNPKSNYSLSTILFNQSL